MRSDAGHAKKRVNIIVPVYADWDSLKQNIDSLKQFYPDNPLVDIYYVNDCGPDVNVIESKIKQEIAGLDNFHYARNGKNLGFVKNCNNAVFNLVKDKAADILLLNSDTIVTEGFLEEMCRILYSQDDICAVNPRSNNATVWSVPTNASLVNKPHKSYKLWQKLKTQIPDKYLSPTAHGFCMLVRRDVINKIGLFDEIYGRGYGEENDFTMRARKIGWICAAANHAFVFHHGSKSFGIKKREDLSTKNSAILLKRYPEYDQLVAQYVSEHPEPMFIRQDGFSYRLFKVFVKAIEYGHVNGYRDMVKRASIILKNRFFASEISHNPQIQVWTHEITKSGAPLVLFDIIMEWRKENDFPDNITFNVPFGTRLDQKLLRELKDSGIHFNVVRMTEAYFGPNDIVILNSTSQPEWLYQKIIDSLFTGTLRKLYFYIHEDDEHTTGGTNRYRGALKELISSDRMVVYAPSGASAENWKKYFETTKNVFSMPGHIAFHDDMFRPKLEQSFDTIDFVIAGSREPRKGILEVLHALQTIERYHILQAPDDYRDFTLTVVGDDHNYDFHNRFIRNAASYFGDKIRLIGNTDHAGVYTILKESNVTITYSMADSLSMVTFEGMAFGHPIIRSEASGLKEQLVIGKNGWLARTSNWGELVDALEEILNKTKTSNKKLVGMSRESVKIAKGNYSSRYRILDDIRRDLA